MKHPGLINKSTADQPDSFEWTKETNNNAWKNELVKIFGIKGEKYKGNIRNH